MLLGIFTHIETLQGNTQFGGQHFGYFGFTYSGRTDEEQACQRFVFIQQSGFGHLYGFHYLADRLFLAVNFGTDTCMQTFQ